MDPYVYPGTSVLKNRRDIRDPERLSLFEMDMVTRRLLELAVRPLSGGFDAEHLQAIHRYLFQDVYVWAGEFRTVRIAKSGDLFALPEYIVSSLEKTCDELKAEGHLEGAGIERFCRRGAYYFGEINAVHPFRDGNGRAQREFLRLLGLRSGLLLQWSRVSRDQMMDASRRSFRGDNGGFEQVLRSAVDPHG